MDSFSGPGAKLSRYAEPSSAKLGQAEPTYPFANKDTDLNMLFNEHLTSINGFNVATVPNDPCRHELSVLARNLYARIIVIRTGQESLY